MAATRSEILRSALTGRPVELGPGPTAHDAMGRDLNPPIGRSLFHRVRGAPVSRIVGYVDVDIGTATRHAAIDHGVGISDIIERALRAYLERLSGATIALATGSSVADVDAVAAAAKRQFGLSAKETATFVDEMAMAATESGPQRRAKRTRKRATRKGSVR
jgi:hypothetical protein